MTRPLNIAIAGAGIGGLASAALLAGDGHNVQLFDRFKAPAPVGSGLVIQPVGQTVLQICGAGAALSQGARINRMLGFEAVTGARVLDVAYDLPSGDQYGLAIHRASLFDALLHAARAQGVTPQPDAQVVGAPQTDRGRMLVMESGARLGPFDLVVDGTGARSMLSPLKGRQLSYGAIWATVPWPADTPLPRDHLSQRYRLAYRMIGVLPIGTLPGDPTQRAAVFWSLPSTGEAAFRARPIEVWKAEAVALWPEIAPFLAGVTQHHDLTMARYEHGTLRSPFEEGLVFLGDAAHRASPQLGQGANMALLDALALRQVLRRYPIAKALPAYAAARRWHIWMYQLLSATFTPQYQSDSIVQPMLRDYLFRPLSRVPPMPRILTRLVTGRLLPPLGRGTEIAELLDGGDAVPELP
ncbi:MAG: NAD(P)/FAD-dependent oxidoreductase [Pseudomonadota bacterium]